MQEICNNPFETTGAIRITSKRIGACDGYEGGRRAGDPSSFLVSMAGSGEQRANGGHVTGMGSPEHARTHARGTFTFDVHTEEGGGWLKRDNSTGRLHEYDSDKGEGLKLPKILRTSYVNGPSEGLLRGTTSNGD